MPDDPTASMNREITISGGGYAVVLIAAIVFAFGGKPVFESVINAPATGFLATLFVALVSAVAFGLGYILVVFDVHYSIDRLFGTKRRVDRYIAETLWKVAPQALKKHEIEERAKAVDKKRHLKWWREKRLQKEHRTHLLYVFYEFVDKPDDTWPALKAEYFDRWTPYCVFMIWVGLGLAGLFFLGLAVWKYHREDEFTDFLFWFSVVTVVLSASAALLISWRFVETVADPQLIKITNDNNEALLAILSRRFGAT